ncbi:MAG: [protein-PII] uridylyltransferase [Rubrivivax sp.]
MPPSPTCSRQTLLRRPPASQHPLLQCPWVWPGRSARPTRGGTEAQVDLEHGLRALPPASARAGPPADGERGAWRVQRDTLIRAFSPRMSPASLLRRITAQTDRAVTSLWRAHRLGRFCSLLAVGGYGRAELFPGSDVDLLVCIHDAAEAHEVARVAAFIGQCWDLGLEVGHAVRTLGECLSEAAADITIDTALLEARLLAGDAEVVSRLYSALGAQRRPREFMEAKLLEMQQRHARYDDSPYSLEPHVKESPGGLRDLHLLAWLARVAGLPASWRGLAQAGILSEEEARTLAQAQRVLSLIRISLHRLSGRREDRLVFDLQGRVARDLGITAPTGLHVSEALMQRYYMAAKRVSQMRTVLLQLIESRLFFPAQRGQIEDLDHEFIARDRWIALRDPGLIERDLRVVMRTFVMRQRHPGLRGIAPELLRSIWLSRARMDREFRRDPQQRERFMQLFTEGAASIEAIRDMNQWSVLGRYLPEWRRIVGRMQHDLFHVYTVDQHILMVLRNVRRFFIPEHAHEYPFCSQLAANWDEPMVLYVAALFHDVAKGRGGDHSDLGAREVRSFCRAHGIAREPSELIAFLVQHHLTMSRIAQKEDLSDPEVILAFVRLVGTERRLTALYLLTVADIRGTSPKVWNAWKGKLLEDLYRLTLRALGGARPNLDADIQARKQEARQLLALHSALPGTEAPLWQAVDLGYFARHDTAEIAWHARVLWRHLESRAPVVQARPSPAGEGLQVLVWCPDQPDLFARICGYFDAAGFSIQDAKVHTTRTGYALDTFQIVSVGGATSAAEYRSMIALVESQAAAALASPGPLPEPLQSRRSRRVRSFPMTPRVSLEPDERGQRWLLSVSASDRSGLLYAIARVLARHQVNLQLAKISTLGERVEDTFLVHGPQLQLSKAQLQIESELLDALA